MNLTKEITKLEKSRVKLDVTIPKTELEKAYQELLQKYAKNVQIPGFRKGKAPVSILEKKYGEAIKGDAAGDIMEKALGEVFEQADEFERPLPYSRPTMENAPEIELGKDMSFSVTYDVFPKVTLEKTEGFKIEVPQVAIGTPNSRKNLQRSVSGTPSLSTVPTARKRQRTTSLPSITANSARTETPYQEPNGKTLCSPSAPDTTSTNSTMK